MGLVLIELLKKYKNSYMSQKKNPKKIPLIKFSKRVKDLLCSRKQSKKNFQLVSKNNYKYFKRSKLFFDYCYCFPYEFYKDNSFRFHLYTKKKKKKKNPRLNPPLKKKKKKKKKKS